MGGHYAAVFAETIPPKPKSGSHIDRVGSIFYLAVGGDLHTEGSVRSYVVPPLQFLAPVDGTLAVANTGNVHFSTDITAQLWSPFGKVGKPVTLRGEVLPATVRQFAISLPTSSPIGLYKALVTVEYAGKTVRLSRWMLLIPKLTLIILSTTLGLILVLGAWSVVRRVRRRRNRADSPGPAAS
ncbi:MAG TPA: hypothetical protein VI322_00455 [Candidatus Saccharimonadia bacterium]